MSLDLIALWHERARPNPTAEQFNVQLGCHFEEIVEMLDTLDTPSPITRHALTALHDNLVWLSMGLKLGDVTVTVADRQEFLDSLADQVVTAVGTGHCAGMKTVEACRRVNASNWSKFDQDGKPIFNQDGKVVKGPNYLPPDLKGLY